MITLALFAATLAILSYTALVDSFGEGPAHIQPNTLAITDDRDNTHEQGEIQ